MRLCIVIVFTLVPFGIAYGKPPRTFLHDRRNTDREKFTALAGSITSPDYPKDYQSYMNNYYKIILPEDKTIQIKVNDVDIESGDKLTVYVVKNNNYLPIKTLTSDDVDKPLNIDTNLVMIHFATDHGGSGRGFSIDYFAIDKTNVERRNAPEVVTRTLSVAGTR